MIRTERLTPHMQRVVFGGEDLAEFAADTYTDHYLKLLFPAPGASYPEPFDLERIREEFPREQWPVTRTYTVRDWDAERRELTVDFVVHGDEGLAGPWAARARAGDGLHFLIVVREQVTDAAEEAGLAVQDAEYFAKLGDADDRRIGHRVVSLL